MSFVTFRTHVARMLARCSSTLVREVWPTGCVFKVSGIWMPCEKSSHSSGCVGDNSKGGQGFSLSGTWSSCCFAQSLPSQFPRSDIPWVHKDRSITKNSQHGAAQLKCNPWSTHFRHVIPSMPQSNAEKMVSYSRSSGQGLGSRLMLQIAWLG